MRVKRNRGDGWLGVLIALVEFIIAGIRFLIVKVREFTKNAQMEKKTAVSYYGFFNRRLNQLESIKLGKNSH